MSNCLKYQRWPSMSKIMYMKSHVGFDNGCAKLILNQYKVDSGIKNTTLKTGNKTTEISHVNRCINQIL